MGIGLWDLSQEELSDVIESGLFGLFGLVGSESGFTPASVTVEGGVSFGFFGNFLPEVSRMGKEEGTFVVFPFSFRVLSLLFWGGVNLASSLSDLLWGIGTGGVFGGWSLSCLGRLPSAGSEGFVKPLGCAVEQSLESGPPRAGLPLCATLCVLPCAILLSTPLKDFAVERSLQSGPPRAGFSLCAVLLFKLHAGPGRVVPQNFTSECSLDSGPPTASISKCSGLRAFLSAGPGWVSTP